MPRLTRLIPFIFVLIWSTGFIGAKFGLPYMEPFFLLVVRYALVLVLFSFGLLLWRKRLLAVHDIPSQLLIGVLIHGAYLAGVFYAISQGIPAGLVAIIVGMQPILTALLGWFWLGDGLERSTLTGLVLGFAGILLVISGAGALPGRGGLDSIGLAATVLALLGISLGTVLQKRLGGDVPVLAGTMVQYIGALLATLPLMLLFETQQVTLTWPLVLTMTWLVLGISVLAISLLMVMIRRDQVARVTSYFYLVPPLAMLQAWLFFGETISALSGLGSILVIAGVYLVIRRNQANAGLGRPQPARG
ncbi:DMT family transporter [Mameliella alba]|uniref:DMT family transporter n=1 Tax=Mameliella alba TaxID=561184 RepID=UPI000B534868|nr:DMT family transporter [Mameliella alba]MBY6118119.1 DMT family transporter [Mameliella alba]OWV42267.1 EamA family transporter [Mameliella alba]OWV63997.1 EamA family transporter [Mameliella alba]